MSAHALDRHERAAIEQIEALGWQVTHTGDPRWVACMERHLPPKDRQDDPLSLQKGRRPLPRADIALSYESALDAKSLVKRVLARKETRLTRFTRVPHDTHDTHDTDRRPEPRPPASPTAAQETNHER
jgi:hypothetical protein